MDEAAPEETRDERRARLAREHPVRFAMQRVAVAVVEVLLGVLGVGALVGLFFRGLLPELDWLPDLSLPQWLKDIEPPEWLRYVDPIYWLGRLDLPWPDVELPSWLTGSATYWGPIVIALLVALGEIGRRRTKAEETDATDQK